MTAGDLIAELKKVPKDCPVYFDTEARCFDVHCVMVKSASYISKEDMAGHEMVILSFDFEQEPHHSNNADCTNHIGAAQDQQ